MDQQVPTKQDSQNILGINIPLATTRLADKLEGAVAQNIYEAANQALTHEAERNGLNVKVSSQATTLGEKTYEGKVPCVFCSLSAPILIAIALILFLVWRV